LFANAPEPAPRGESSSVSEVSLTQLAHERLAAAGGRTAAGPAAGLSTDLDTSLRAATLPPVTPGQTRAAETSGARDESTHFGRTNKPERNGPAR
jgi:hypothetical protein